MLFKTVPIADAVIRAEHVPSECSGWPRHVVVLGWEERLKARGRRRSREGVEFATALPRGTVLREGDVLILESSQLIVEVRALEERVLVVRPTTTEEWALWSYHIGNSHQPLMIAADAIVCADLPGMEQVLTYHAIPFAREQRAFTPVSQAPGHHDER